MLTIKTYVEKSNIPNAGLGLFAAEDISEGDIVWFLDPTVDHVFNVDEYNGLIAAVDEEHKDRFDRWSYRRENDYVLCADNTKFANHSETPNLGGDSKQIDVALRDIKAGEELTYDYRTFDRETDFKLNQGNSYDKGREETRKETGETQS